MGFSAQMRHPNLVLVVPNPKTLRWHYLFFSCALPCILFTPFYVWVLFFLSPLSFSFFPSLA